MLWLKALLLRVGLLKIQYNELEYAEKLSSVLTELYSVTTDPRRIREIGYDRYRVNTRITQLKGIVP
jgi:hypothetical protein